MAYITNQEYKNHLYDGTEQILKVIINNIEIDPAYIRSVKLKDDIFNDSSFSLGSANPCKIELELNNDIIDEIGEFSEVTFQTIMNISSPEIIPMGTFIVNQKDTNSKYFTKYILYDYMSKFDVEYDGSSIVPCTRYQLLQNICDSCGVELKNESIINGNEIVGVFDNTILARDYIKFIAERAGGFAKINRENRLVIKSFNSIDSITLPDNMMGEYETNELKTITGVVYENGIQKFEAGTTDKEVVFLSQESPFSCSQEEVDNINSVLNGLQYQTLVLRIWGDSAIDTGDLIIAKGLKSFAQKDWTWGNGWYGKYNTVLNNISTVSNVSKISNNSKFKRLKSSIDEVNGEIKILATNITEVNDSLNNNYYSIEQTNQLIANAETGLTNTFSEAGGNNIFRNTGLWFETNEQENPYEFWLGKAIKQSNYEATSRNSILLQEGIFEQDEKVGNGVYTVSFTYKKLIELANVKVLINETEYELTELEKTNFYTGQKNSDGEFIVYPLEVNSNHITIKFVSDTDNALEVWDLMVNKGSEKVVWTQNENETTTDTVNISKGITITSSVEDVKFKADYDGIRTLDKSNNRLTEFTDKGMITKEAVVENEANIVGILRQRVGNQVWDSFIG